MLGISLATWLSIGAALLGATHAHPDRTLATSSPTASQSGCPSPIGIKNGGFESGKIAPWTLLSNSNPTDSQKIVSPGNNKSKYALQVDFAAANLTEYSLAQETTGRECYGYYYNISYSWNWVNYTGPQGAPAAQGDSYCSFSTYTGYTDNAPLHYGTRKPGWHHHSYLARDVYSHCKPAYADFIADVTCVGGNEDVTLPAFTMLFDDFKIQATQKNPNPLPPPTSC